jgi:hypothetical protein
MRAAFSPKAGIGPESAPLNCQAGSTSTRVGSFHSRGILELVAWKSRDPPKSLPGLIRPDYQGSSFFAPRATRISPSIWWLASAQRARLLIQSDHFGGATKALSLSLSLSMPPRIFSAYIGNFDEIIYATDFLGSRERDGSLRGYVYYSNSWIMSFTFSEEKVRAPL